MKNVVITILSVLVLGFGCFIIYDKVINKEEKKENSVVDNVKGSEGENNNSAIEEKDFDLKKAEELLDKFGFKEDLGCGNNIYASSYDEDFKQAIVLKRVSDSVKTKKNCSEIYSQEYDSYAYKGENGACYKDKEANLIPYDEANKIYRSMYGEDMPKKGFSMSYNFYDYNQSLNSFVELGCLGGCGGSCAPFILVNKIESAKETADNVIIRVRDSGGGELVTRELPSGAIGWYFTISGNEIELDSTDFPSAEKEIENKYLDKLDLYEIVFTKKDGNYIFKSLTKKLS